MKYKHTKYLLLSLILMHFGNVTVSAQTEPASHVDPSVEWADSVLSTLSFDEMIGQLMIIRANTPGQPYYDVIDSYIQKYNIGGVTFFGGHPTLQAQQTNHWQAIAKTPLFISIDGEWGPAMRLDSIMAFPYQMTLGAISNDSLLYRMGLEVARQCKTLGIHINFAPVVDINSNPDNPVIHMRSFGERKENVAQKGIMYMKGMQDGGLIVTAKHYPGHGDTGSDSHYTLPVINHSKQRLEETELYPFNRLIAEGLDGIMIAHLNVPALDSSLTASTLSKAIVTGLLRNESGFKGLIVTDALDMKGVTLNDEPGDIEVKALLAGNDILLLSANVPAAVARIREASETGILSKEMITERCRKVLQYKYKAGLNRVRQAETKELPALLTTGNTELLVRKMFEEAVTIVSDKNKILPLRSLDTLKIASVTAGYGNTNLFHERLACYADVSGFSLNKAPTDDEISALKEKLEPFNLIILSIQNTSTWGKSPYGISEKLLLFIDQISREKTLILDLFATPYALRLLENMHSPAAVIMSYQDHPVMLDVSAQSIFGGIGAKGKLPVTAGLSYPCGTGISTHATRLKYTIPEELGIKRQDLQKVDDIINDAIQKKAFPGCQVWASKDGKVFLMKSYGYHTYEKEKEVSDFDLYDLASITKIAASTLSVMRLSDERKIDVHQQLQTYLPYLRDNQKGSIVIQEMMAHQSKLKPWIPFYIYTLKDNKPDPAYYSTAISEDFPVRVAEGLYLRKNYHYTIYDSIIQSPLLKTSAYKYSDLGFYFITEMIKNIINQPIEEYADRNFYRPMGLSTMGYLPLKHFSRERIVPTEFDTAFRKQLLHGDVHDQGAAMLGGVSGHAGLFSNANDLGIIGNMLLQKGSYGEVEYIRPETIEKFTAWQFPLNENRRGIGFDKPLPEYDENGPACKSASSESYGHSGFTGTYFWTDPQNGLVYIFLSNRIHPGAGNTRLSQMNIRPKIHQCLYDAIEKSTNFGQ